MSQIAISNIVNVSVLADQAGANDYNTSNLAIFTSTTPANSFGTDGFKAYVEPTDVATDFGSSSIVYEMALAVFGQQPNILAGDGQLIVILMDHAIQKLAFSGTAASGTFVLNYNGDATAAINWDDTASEIQVFVRTLTGLEDAIVTGTIASHTVNVEMVGVYGATPPLLTVTSNSLATSGPVAITITVTNDTHGESLATVITASSVLVQYFGVLVDVPLAFLTETDLDAAAAVLQALSKIGFFVSYTEADILPGGALDDLATASLSHSRGLYYGDSTDLGDNAVLMAASYAGRALSVNFSGSNTTLTMNLKSLAGVEPDPSMSQTIFNEALAAGVDIYASVQGVSCVISNGANSYFDQIYNLLWIVGAIQIAGFNYLRQTATKIPQTEAGMDGLKGAYRRICQQAVSNQYLAPGTWTSPTTFGNQNDLYSNIIQFGFYIYSQPISQQSQTDRANREAPLVQIAIKQAGAIQSSDVLIFVNA